MSGQSSPLYDAGDPTTCAECGAKYIGGDAFHKFTSNVNGMTTELYWCAPCTDYLSRAMWPEEDYGPYGGIPIPQPRGRPS